jgi:acyl-CoA synthetase (AMP-forming)/AMP-acid ligase II
MIDEVCRVFCSEPPRHVLGPDGFDHATVRQALVESESVGRPVMMLGTALAFQALCEWLASVEERFYLPEGSRVMETGGTKGSAKATTPSALREALVDCLGLDVNAIVSEYGMTEACSQFYEGTLRARRDTCEAGGQNRAEADGKRLKFGPPWVRAVICDPETLAPVTPGTPGVLRLIDLANRYSISFLQTEDLAVAPAEGNRGPGSAPFVYLGRVAGAEARGCSLVAEEWARVTAGREP